MTELETDINVLRVGLRDIETVQLAAYILLIINHSSCSEDEGSRELSIMATLYFSSSFHWEIADNRKC